MNKIHFNKLVRDDIPLILDKKDVEYSVYELDDIQFRKELLRKVGEEASAFRDGMSHKEMISELVDLLYVINELKKVFEISEPDLSKELHRNLEKKGGFKKKLFLEWTANDGYGTNEKTT